MEDEQIVTLYWNRDETAIQETQTKYDRYLTKIACNILADMEDSRESVNDIPRRLEFHAAPAAVGAFRVSR